MFITLHTFSQLEDSKPIVINTDHLIQFYTVGKKTFLTLTNGNHHDVIESMQEIRDLISQSTQLKEMGMYKGKRVYANE